jgi:carboxypeptidase family protein
MRVGLVFAVCFLAVAVHGQEDSGSVVGAVTDETQVAIPDALVVLTGKTGPRSKKTQADGSYRFEHLPDGDYKLEFQAAGFVTGTVSSFVIASSMKVIPAVALGVSSCADPPLAPPHQSLSSSPELSGLRGAISDAKGRGIGNVAIRIARVDGKAGTLVQTSDDRGLYTFSDLQPGVYRLTATRAFYYPEVVQVRLMAGLEAALGVELERCRDRRCDPKMKRRKYALCE